MKKSKPSIYDEWVLLEDEDFSFPLLPIRSASLRPIFLRRGVRSEEAFRRFVSPAIEDLHDPSTIHGMAQACERIRRAIEAHEPILIYGDYDVDGVTSIVLLRTVIGALGGSVDFVVPHRLTDGYGLKIEVLDRVLAEKRVGLVITVDCGISSVEPVQKAIDRGIDVIITDHHLPPGILPEAAAVLNPKQPGCLYPFKELAGVGVAFKLCCELLRLAGHRMSIESLAKIAALGTIADVAPLIGENRTIARLGLAGLADVRNRGLRAMLNSLGLAGKALRSHDVGFKIGPRINAAGRLASADTAIRLFAAATDAEADELVEELNRLNGERQKLEAQTLVSAEAQVGPKRILILAGEDWHKGVLGLCAGRLAQKYHRPTLMISIAGDQCVGSARSISSIDLHHQLDRCRELFTHFGGHEFACGFSFPLRNLEPLRARLEDQFGSMDEDRFTRRAHIDAVVRPADLNADFAAELSLLEPFGQGNPAPLFLIRNLQVGSRREFSPDCHDLTLVDDSGTATAVLWPSRSGLLPMLTAGQQCDIVGFIEPDRFASRGLRLVIEDASPSTGSRLRNESVHDAVVTAG